MQRALTREPQVAITRHLVPQLAPGGLLVPERITVEACLADPANEHVLDAAHPLARHRIPLGTLLTLARDAIGPTDPVVVELPGTAEGFRLQLSTRIQVYSDLVLGDYDSGVTLPVPVPIPAGARRIEFEYHIGTEPGWRHRAI